MKSPAFSNLNRRTFLKYLAGSPYVAALDGIRAFAERWAPEIAEVMADPKEAFSVMDFEEATRSKVDPVHWPFLASGVDDDATLRANREGFQRIQLRPPRLRDASQVDMRTDLFGRVYNSPIFTCPAPGETLIRMANSQWPAPPKREGPMQMLSTSTSTAVEDVNSAHGRPVWYQLYAPTAWEACEKLVRRVEAAGCPVIALTVDHNAGRNSETYLRALPKDVTQCLMCHTDGLGPTVKERKMYDGINMTGVAMQNPSMAWEFVDRLRKATPLKLLIKGIDTREDAHLVVEHGMDGILVSNHGGRAIETGRSTIEALPEIANEVRGRIPVFLDGGVRRGADVFLWGLGAFWQAGVERVLEILQGELRLVMANCGTLTVAAIDGSYVATPERRP
jgi:4-hydroxymandelate oxidase